MILVHQVCQTKWGRAHEVAEAVKEDAVFEANGHKLFSHPDFQRAQAKSECLIVGGRREFFTVV